jgi:hypothetical protein
MKVQVGDNMKFGVLVVALLVALSTPALADWDRDNDRSEKRYSSFGGFNSWQSVDSGPRVRVIHASPDAPAVDVKVEGEVAFANAPFTGVTDYAQLTRGRYDVEVVPAGADEPVVIDANLRLKDRLDYTVIALGELANIEPLVLVDRNTVFSSRIAKVRFVHAGADAPAVDIAVKDGRVLARNLEFGEASRYLRVPAGEYDLEVRVAGTKTVALALDDIDLDGRTAYTAVVTGLLADNTLQPILAVDESRYKR